MNGNKAVEVTHITRRYGSVTAVDDISFSVDEGEIFGFLGPNGAGKTTLIRMLTTRLMPTDGSARVGSFDVVRHPDDVRKAIGVVPQAMTSDLDLTGYENMDIYGRFYGIPTQIRKERIRDLLEKVGLTARANDLVATYSGGMRRRLEIARVLVHHPKILFLDKPSIGLDPQSRRVVGDFLKDLRNENNVTIFLTTHYMEEAEALCGRVAIIDGGKIIALGTPEELKARIPGNDIVTFVLEDGSDSLCPELSSLPYVHEVKTDNGELQVYLDYGAQNLTELIDRIKSHGSKILSVSIRKQSLEDVFIHFTGKSIRDEETKKFSFLIGAGIPQKR
jgi:ABC-2 type transport system ATP-binding protein